MSEALTLTAKVGRDDEAAAAAGAVPLVSVEAARAMIYAGCASCVRQRATSWERENEKTIRRCTRARRKFPERAIVSGARAGSCDGDCGRRRRSKPNSSRTCPKQLEASRPSRFSLDYSISAMRDSHRNAVGVLYEPLLCAIGLRAVTVRADMP